MVAFSPCNLIHEEYHVQSFVGEATAQKILLTVSCIYAGEVVMKYLKCSCTFPSSLFPSPSPASVSGVRWELVVVFALYQS